MSLIFAEPHKSFETELEEDEEILWIGEPKSKLWWLSLKRLFLLLVGVMGGIGVTTFVSLCLYFLLFIISFDIDYRYTTVFEKMFWPIFFISIIAIIGLLIAVVKALIKALVKIFEAALRKKYYFITNQRVLIYEYGTVKAYSLILMADAIKHKPKGGKTTISLYDKTSSTGKMPAPIAKLNNLAEKEAEKAYDLLKDAREDSFLERMAELEQAQS